MASYFKNKREITVLSPTFSPEKYSRFYLRKDFYDGSFIPGLNKYPNLECGGLAFSGNTYVPLPEEIEEAKPDPYIYERYKDLFIDDVNSQKGIFSTLLNSPHARLSLDGKTMWPRFEKQLPLDKKGRVFFFHDVDLGAIEDSPEAVRYLLEKYSKEKKSMAFLGTKFPIHCKNYQDFKVWNQFSSSDSFFSIQIDNVLDDEEFAELISSIRPATAKKIRYQIASSSSDKNHFLKVILPKIFKQVIFCCNQHKQISLVISDDFLINKEWQDVVTLLNLYMSAAESYTRVPALCRFCKSLKPREWMYQSHVMCREEARELFYYVYNNHQELFQMFYECSKVELKGGSFCFDKLGNS